MKSYRFNHPHRVRDSIARTGVAEPRYEREWQSINNGEDLTLKIDADEIVGFGRSYDPDLQAFKPTTHDLTLRIRVKITVEFE